MADKNLARRLAAILAADVVGYTRLMEANEEGTLSTLKRHRRDFFDPAVARHGGRIFKTMGDGVLVEFASVLNAARCAVEIQRGMPARNAGLPEDRQIRFRIGLHVGDLIVDGDDFYGDGVNLAARLEGLAGPGGIACSAMVRQQIGNRLDAVFLDQGRKAVKNIAEPVQVFFVDLAGPAPDQPVAVGRPAPSSVKPSVAILPFANMSHDPDQEFFSDGITEDIITDLAKVSGLFVLGRNTVFTYKGRAVNLEQVARELGVGHLVEGSVRKAGNRVRITAQLIEGATGGHVWAERYDRELTDIFAVQDEITQAIVMQLKVRLLPEEKEAIERAPTNSVEAYSFYLKGREHFRMRIKEDIKIGRQFFLNATKLDPLYSRAYGGIAECDWYLSLAYDEELDVDDILETVDLAIKLNPDIADLYAIKGGILGDANRIDEARLAFKRALDLDPDSIDVRLYCAEFCLMNKDSQSALVHYRHAASLDPTDFRSLNIISMIFRSMGQLEDARAIAKLGLERVETIRKLHPEQAAPVSSGAQLLAAVGRLDEAKAWADLSVAMAPNDRLIQFNAAASYAMLGEIETAVSFLERSAPSMGGGLLKWVIADHDLDPVRRHPRYLALMSNLSEK